MLLKVIKYEPHVGAHRCKDESGKERLVDIQVDGKLTGDPESWVGKTIRCELSTYMSIAMFASEEPTPQDSWKEK